MRKSLVACLVALVMLRVAAHAQSTQSVGAYLALNGTPVAALPPVLTSTILTTLQRTVQFSARYGYIDNNAYSTNGQAANNGGATVVFPTSLGSTISVTAGVWYPSGTGYSSHLMLGVAGDYGIGSMQIGVGTPIIDSSATGLATRVADTLSPPLLSFSVDGEIGYGSPSRGTYWAGRIGAPITLGQRGSGMRVAGFVTPSLGWGYSQLESVNVAGAPITTTASGVRMVIGGGVGVYTPASLLSMSLGFQHVFVTGASTLVGLVVSLGTR